MTRRALGRSLALLALVSTGVVGGCGGESDRDRVEGYLDDANAIQKRSAPAFRRANKIYARFSTGDLPRTRAPEELARAEGSIRSARARLAKLDPPKETAELHRRLLRVYDLNARLARETTQLARYLPAAAAALQPLSRVNRRLRERLGSSAGPEAQGQALGQYAETLKGVAARLKRLRPPPVLAASDRARIERLTLTRKLAAGLQSAIEGRDPRRVAQLLLRFRRVNAEQPTRTFATQSLRAYNRRYREVFRAAGAVQQERRRIERSL